MKRIFLLLPVFLVTITGYGQSNIVMTNIKAGEILKGNFDPAQYLPSVAISQHEEIICTIQNEISPDSLKSYLEVLGSFQNRNTYSDTVSSTKGIGAARRWIYNKFGQFSRENEDRLIRSYLQFDWLGGSCGDGKGLRNILAVLPGSDTSNHAIVIIEAHMDSRCEDRCDTACIAHGIDDNGSGTALVIELARVMSQFSIRHTLVFMATVGEEHGLFGGHAMAQYCLDNQIKVKAVQNNDIVGGIICGNTASPPGCPGVNMIDSTHVRLFSNGNISFPHRGFARTIKMYYEEKMPLLVKVPMNIEIFNQEDRTGRGGDHIPFRQRGYRNVRMTSSYENGHGAPNANYKDRQHTSGDILGIDTDNDQVIDSFFVDFNYLKRNTVINGMTATLVALGPEPPSFQLTKETSGYRVAIDPIKNIPEYRIGVRVGSSSTYFEGVYRTQDTSFMVPGMKSGKVYYISVASLDSNHIMSPFSAEEIVISTLNTDTATKDALRYAIQCNALGIRDFKSNKISYPVELQSCRPNPLTDYTVIPVNVTRDFDYDKAFLKIRDMYGKLIWQKSLQLKAGLQNIQFNRANRPTGIYYFSLEIDGQTLQTKKMVIVN
jgi:Peptidase family M28/Secretion system C-terminal sorting domain